MRRRRARLLTFLLLFSPCGCEDPLPRAPVLDQRLPIRRIAYADLTFDMFYAQFRQRDRPLIITAVPEDQSVCFGGQGRFNDSMLRSCAGDVRVDRMVSGVAARKGVQRFANLPFAMFLRMFGQEGSFDRRFSRVEPIMATSAGVIRDHCAKLWQHLRFPAYFTGEVCLVPGTAGWPCTRFPQFYFSQKGSRQTFHTDTARTEMWSAICRGKKRYSVVPITQVWRKYGQDFNLPEALRRPEDWPLGLRIWEGTLETGDILYLPAGAMHAVQTEEDTVNVVDNFVDAGRLGELSSVNLELMRRGEMHPYGQMLKWLARDDLRTDVFDETGVVEDRNATARGFPPWAALVARIGRTHRLSARMGSAGGACLSDGLVQCA